MWFALLVFSWSIEILAGGWFLHAFWTFQGWSYHGITVPGPGPSDAGLRPPDGGRQSSRVLAINWHRWRYRRAARRREHGRSSGPARPRVLELPISLVA